MKLKHLNEQDWLSLIEHINTETVNTRLTQRERGAMLCLNILCQTGIRAEELIKLKVSDHDSLNKRLYITAAKGSNDRVLRISEDLNEKLIKAIRVMGLNNDDVLVGIIDRFYTRGSKGHAAKQYLREVWRELRVKLFGAIGSRLPMHSLRHTVAVRVLESNGGQVLKAKVALGHKSIDSTMHYLDYITTRDIEDEMISAVIPTRSSKDKKEIA